MILLAAGSMVPRALEVRSVLRKEGIEAAVVNCSTVKPLDKNYLASLPKDAKVFTMEEHMLSGGFGESVIRACLDSGWTVPVHCFGVEDAFVQHGCHERLMKDAGLDAETIAETVRRSVKGAEDVG